MKITAHIPVQTYGFIEIEGEPSEKAEIERLYNEYAEKPVKFKNKEGYVLLTSFTGEQVYWNEEKHDCRSLAGVSLRGGSGYSKQFGKPFDAEMILAASSKAWGVPAEDIQKIWNANRDMSGDFGTVLHTALETAHMYWDIGEKIKDNKKWKTGETPENYSLPKQPVLRKAVLSYIKAYGIKGKPEVLVTDVKNGMCGWIDSLHIIDEDKKICDLEDYKTSVMDKAKAIQYNHQQSYYGKILENFGWTVRNILLRDYDGEKWNSETQKMLEVKL